MIGSGPDTFSWRIDFPPSPGHIILEADGISCLVGQNFLGKCVPWPGGQIFLRHRHFTVLAGWGILHGTERSGSSIIFGTGSIKHRMEVFEDQVPVGTGRRTKLF